MLCFGKYVRLLLGAIVSCGGTVVSDPVATSSEGGGVSSGKASAGVGGGGGEGGSMASGSSGAGGGCTGCLEHANGVDDGPLCPGAVQAWDSFATCECLTCVEWCGDPTPACMYETDHSGECINCLSAAQVCTEEFQACKATND